MDYQKVINKITSNEYKQEGLNEWLSWKGGSFRGHFRKGLEIIEKFDMEEEVEQLKLIMRREAQRLSSQRYRDFSPVKVAEQQRKFYQRNKEALKEYCKSDKVKAKRREREKIKSELYRDWKVREKWLN